tara:strand:+ start:180 stop:506 length:327 start_codon:yes stop_codon:yes gene_type:complete
MEITNSLFWFTVGAGLCQLLRHFIYYNEERKVFVKIVTTYIILIQKLKKQMQTALLLKKECLKDSGQDENSIEQMTKGERELIEGWEMVTTSILVNSVPKKFHKYFER